MAGGARRQSESGSRLRMDTDGAVSPSGQRGAWARLIIITFNLLLKITQSQVKKDHRA